MRVPKKILFFICILFLNTVSIYAVPTPVPGSVPPPPRGLPINDSEWILWFGALLLAGYIVINNIKHRKAPFKQ